MPINLTSIFLIADNEVYRISLDTANTMNLYWQVNYKTDELSFEVHISRTFGWFALGFSDYGELFPADYCVLWYNWKHESMFQASKLTLHMPVSFTFTFFYFRTFTPMNME